MRAIILAAGRGKRIQEVTGNKPKCLLNVGGQTLIEHQVHTLKSLSIDDITVVVGYGPTEIRRVCGDLTSYIENVKHNETNSLFSLWLARDKLVGDCIVLNGDVLFHPQLLRDLIKSCYEDALLVDFDGQKNCKLGDEEMKVVARNQRVAQISKIIDPSQADGENVGIAKFGPTGVSVLTDKIDQLIARGGHGAWAPSAFQEFAIVRPLYIIATRGLPWIEIDYPSDYARAINEIMPQITALTNN